MATFILIIHTKPTSCASCNIEHFTGRHNNNHIQMSGKYCFVILKVLFCYTDHPYQLINDMDFICVLKKNPICGYYLYEGMCVATVIIHGTEMMAR